MLLFLVITVTFFKPYFNKHVFEFSIMETLVTVTMAIDEYVIICTFLHFYPHLS